MSPEPRFEADYSDRQVAAARRVLIDLGQVLASFHDAIVVVGGWVPDLLLPASAHLHIGSIDVDLALNARLLVDKFRVLQFPACEVAFRNPQDVELDGEMISGASNKVRLQVASLPDFLILKAHAVGGATRGEPLVEGAVAVLREKFKAVDQYGPAAACRLSPVRKPG